MFNDEDQFQQFAASTGVNAIQAIAAHSAIIQAALKAHRQAMADHLAAMAAGSAYPMPAMPTLDPPDGASDTIYGGNALQRMVRTAQT